MKEFITPKYFFSPGTSDNGFVDLFGISNFEIGRLVAIINQKRGVIIYSTASESNKYTRVIDNKVYLAADTSSYSSDDQLQIIYNTESTTVDVVVMLSTLLNAILNPGNLDKTINAERVTLVGGSTTISSGTVTTLSTLSNIVNNNGYPSQIGLINNNMNAWTNTCRNKIT
jgi:hypothetical protein